MGEKKIEEYLQKNNIQYETQKSLDNCKNKRPLKFDFYLPTYDVLIEFDGGLHFEAKKYFGGIDGLSKRRECDLVKNVFCIRNKKYLFRISDNDIRNVEQLIENYLNKQDKKIIEYSTLSKYFDIIIETNDKLLKDSDTLFETTKNGHLSTNKKRFKF
jgi:hypothetical protein